MKIETLKEIGGRIFNEVNRFKDLRQEAIERGAAGDKTYPVDKKAEEIILHELAAGGEPLTIISEEAGLVQLNGGGLHVVIDPVDGSRNAISGIPFYATSIAVADGDTLGDINTAYIINLVTGDEFWAEKGKGAYMNGRPMEAQRDSIFHLVAYESQVPARDIAKASLLFTEARKTRCLGATALDLAYLAEGAVSVFISPAPSRSFDFGGGYLLVKEAGGIITDTDGVDISGVRLGLERSTPLLASGNEALHEKALELLHQ